MKHVFPNYYRKFKCLAGACRHTCCAGWEIDIDPDSLKRFSEFPGIMAHVDLNAETPCFQLLEHDICPFLNTSGLCDMIIEHGESMLCDICTDHPRFRNWLSDRVETGLGMCCEAASALILDFPERFALTIENDDTVSEPLTEDEAYVLSIREAIFKRLADRSHPVSARMEVILRETECPIPDHSRDTVISMLMSLERLDDAWEKTLEDLSSNDAFTNLRFDSSSERALENLAFYFFYRHLLPACEDGELSGRIRLCAFLWYTAANLILTRQPYDPAFSAEICRRLSCEIEYSDENISRLIEWLDIE